MRSTKSILVNFIILFFVFLVSFFLFYRKIDSNLLVTSCLIAFVLAIWFGKRWKR